jgi:hypothetical protein
VRSERKGSVANVEGTGTGGAICAIGTTSAAESTASSAAVTGTAEDKEGAVAATPMRY